MHEILAHLIDGAIFFRAFCNPYCNKFVLTLNLKISVCHILTFNLNVLYPLFGNSISLADFSYICLTITFLNIPQNYPIYGVLRYFFLHNVQNQGAV